MELKENILFHNRYRLIREIGRGGFSEVWLVKDTRTNINIVLKVYASGTGLDEDGTKVFSEEFSLVFDFNHSNLLKPAHYDVYDRRPYLILPFCKDGSSLKLVGRITEEKAWKFLHDVASGLAYLHGQKTPVIHQDIKPANVLMADNGQFMITDFGISAKVQSTLRRSVGQQNVSGGTLAYMGPERFSKDNIPIKASDIWALGATLYELLVGDAPFEELGGVKQRSGAEIPNVKGEWSKDLKHIVNLCLQLETWNRPTAETIVTWTEQHFRGEKIIFDKKKPSKKEKKLVKDTIKDTIKKDTTKSGRKSKLGLIIRICVAVVVLIAIIIGIGGYQKEQRRSALYTQFEYYQSEGDSYYSKGENSYKKALEMYEDAIETADEIEELDGTVMNRDYLLRKRNELADKIDDIFNELVQKGNNLSEKYDDISKRQAIANYEDALKLKDDVNVQKKINNLKNELN